MLQPSDPPQLVSSTTSSSANEAESSSRQLPQQAQYPYHYQQQGQYGHHVAPPQPQGYGPGSLPEPAYGVQGAEQLQGEGGEFTLLSAPTATLWGFWIRLVHVHVHCVCT